LIRFGSKWLVLAVVLIVTSPASARGRLLHRCRSNGPVVCQPAVFCQPVAECDPTAGMALPPEPAPPVLKQIPEPLPAVKPPPA
jgi:hypothetical protein